MLTSLHRLPRAVAVLATSTQAALVLGCSGPTAADPPAGHAGNAAGGAPSAGMGPTAGMPAQGGRANAAGGSGSGGALSSGGRGSGGAGNAGSGGMGNAGSGGSGGSSGSTSGSCTVSVTHSMSEMIGTVGIVEFSTTSPSIDSANIEYGLDTSYGKVAPVDVKEPKYRTLVLGMKADKPYHARVVAVSGGTTCTSDDFTLQTGLLPNGLNKPTVDTKDKTKLYGGYMVTARWGMNNGGPAMILDEDGDIVWWYDVEDDVIRARLSFDGKRIWIRNTNQSDNAGWVRRLTLDGLTEEKFDLTHTTHDLAVLPDGNVGLIAHAADGCWDIEEFNPTTQTLTPLFNPSEAHGSTMCQVNYLAYHQGDDSYWISDFRQSTVIKISRKGELIYVVNGTKSTISGTNWSGQHGIHVLGPDQFIVFSNNGEGGGSNSLIYELKVDPTAKSASELWRYDGGIKTPFGGDIQRLDNGNTLITFSSSGVIQEVSATGELLQSFTFPLGGGISYMEKRKSLYSSPPPKINGI